MVSEEFFNEMMNDSKNIAMAAGELLRQRCRDLGIRDIIGFIFLREICDCYLELLEQDMSKPQQATFKALEEMIIKKIRKNLEELKEELKNESRTEAKNRTV